MNMYRVTFLPIADGREETAANVIAADDAQARRLTMMQEKLRPLARQRTIKSIQIQDVVS